MQGTSLTLRTIWEISSLTKSNNSKWKTLSLRKKAPGQVSHSCQEQTEYEQTQDWENRSQDTKSNNNQLQTFQATIKLARGSNKTKDNRDKNQVTPNRLPPITIESKDKTHPTRKIVEDKMEEFLLPSLKTSLLPTEDSSWLTSNSKSTWKWSRNKSTDSLLPTTLPNLLARKTVWSAATLQTLTKALWGTTTKIE